MIIPDNFIGKEIEVLAFEIEKKINDLKCSKRKSFDAIKLELSGFKFNREEATERLLFVFKKTVKGQIAKNLIY